MTAGQASSLRRRLYAQLDPRARRAKGLSPLNRVLMVLILVATGLATVETEPALAAVYGRTFVLAEGAIQPDKFGGIPRALWWSVATKTTIGYSDVYPVTVLGKVLAAVTAIFSIGFIAMPTGILAASFSDAMQRHRSALQEAPADDSTP